MSKLSEGFLVVTTSTILALRQDPQATAVMIPANEFGIVIDVIDGIDFSSGKYPSAFYYILFWFKGGCEIFTIISPFSGGNDATKGMATVSDEVL